MFQLIVANTLSLTSLHAFIACIAALVWQLTNMLLAFSKVQLSSKDLYLVGLYIGAPIMLVLIIGIFEHCKKVLSENTKVESSKQSLLKIFN
jgi:hypothetical protein